MVPVKLLPVVTFSHVWLSRYGKDIIVRIFLGLHFVCCGAKFCLGAFNPLVRNDKEIRFVTWSFRGRYIKVTSRSRCNIALNIFETPFRWPARPGLV